jgi:hypothetical protein
MPGILNARSVSYCRCARDETWIAAGASWGTRKMIASGAPRSVVGIWKSQPSELQWKARYIPPDFGFYRIAVGAIFRFEVQYMPAYE